MADCGGVVRAAPRTPSRHARRAAPGSAATSSSGYSSQAMSSEARARSTSSSGRATMSMSWRRWCGSVTRGLTGIVRPCSGRITSAGPAGKRRSAPPRPARPRPRTSPATSRAASARRTSSSGGGGGRAPGHEELAAVLVGQRADLEGADAPRLLRDLLLVHADQRPQDRPARGLVDDGHVVEGLRGDLAQALAGDQRLARALRAGQRLRDAHHEAPVEHDAQRRRAGGHDRLLHLAEGDEQQAGAELVAGEDARQLACLVDGRVVLQREGVEVHERPPCSRASSGARPPPASRCRPRAAPSRAPRCRPGSRPAPGQRSNE